MLSSGIEGYLVKVGQLDKIQRSVIIIGGLSLAFPNPVITGIGAGICLLALGIPMFIKHYKVRKQNILYKGG